MLMTKRYIRNHFLLNDSGITLTVFQMASIVANLLNKRVF